MLHIAEVASHVTQHTVTSVCALFLRAFGRQAVPEAAVCGPGAECRVSARVLVTLKVACGVGPTPSVVTQLQNAGQLLRALTAARPFYQGRDSLPCFHVVGLGTRNQENLGKMKSQPHFPALVRLRSHRCSQITGRVRAPRWVCPSSNPEGAASGNAVGGPSPWADLSTTVCAGQADPVRG